MKVLVFGANGALGEEVVEHFMSRDHEVFKISRRALKEFISWPINAKNTPDVIKKNKKFDVCIWCQGSNVSDSIKDFNENKYHEIQDANVNYILSTLSTLISQSLLNKKSKLVIVSSIWQEHIKTNKLSYAVSKSSISGLVKSLATDLADDKIRVNAVLPGVIDSKMTRSNLSKLQINSVKNRTGFKRLINFEDVAKVIYFLSSEDSSGISGQSIKVDLGFSNINEI
jgi:3-oxoacyl-[acyl-carrier protein] reductase